MGHRLLNNLLLKLPRFRASFFSDVGFLYWIFSQLCLFDIISTNMIGLFLTDYRKLYDIFPQLCIFYTVCTTRIGSFLTSKYLPSCVRATRNAAVRRSAAMTTAAASKAVASPSLTRRVSVLGARRFNISSYPWLGGLTCLTRH